MLSKRKLFVIAFVIDFILTALLCLILRLPLIFYPIDYGFSGFLFFAVLIGGLCFCLVFINIPLLRIIKNIISPGVNELPFYIMGTLIVLQLVTLMLGYVESGIETRNPDFFYYYKGVSNSLVYILTGNLTAVVVAYTYAKEQIRLKKEAEIKFEFDSK